MTGVVDFNADSRSKEYYDQPWIRITPKEKNPAASSWVFILILV